MFTPLMGAVILAAIPRLAQALFSNYVNIGEQFAISPMRVGELVQDKEAFTPSLSLRHAAHALPLGVRSI